MKTVSDGDVEKSKNFKKSQAGKRAWQKYRLNIQSGINKFQRTGVNDLHRELTDKVRSSAKRTNQFKNENAETGSSKLKLETSEVGQMKHIMERLEKLVAVLEAEKDKGKKKPKDKPAEVEPDVSEAPDEDFEDIPKDDELEDEGVEDDTFLDDDSFDIPDDIPDSPEDDETEGEVEGDAGGDGDVPALDPEDMDQDDEFYDEEGMDDFGSDDMDADLSTMLRGEDDIFSDDAETFSAEDGAVGPLDGPGALEGPERGEGSRPSPLDGDPAIGDDFDPFSNRGSVEETVGFEEFMANILLDYPVTDMSFEEREDGSYVDAKFSDKVLSFCLYQTAEGTPMIAMLDGDEEVYRKELPVDALSGNEVKPRIMPVNWLTGLIVRKLDNLSPEFESYSRTKSFAEEMNMACTSKKKPSKGKTSGAVKTTDLQKQDKPKKNQVGGKKSGKK
jgi:hypothetical protein